MSARPKTIVCDYPGCSQQAEEDHRPGWGRQEITPHLGWYTVYDFCPEHHPHLIAFLRDRPIWSDKRYEADMDREARYERELSRLKERYSNERKEWEKANPPPSAPWVGYLVGSR